MQETFSQKLLYGSIAILSIVGFFGIIYYFDEIIVWFYYISLYKIFADELYFPFYLYVFHIILLLMFVLIVACYFLFIYKKVWQRFLTVTVILGISILFAKTGFAEIADDFALIKMNSYSKSVYDVGSIEKNLKKYRSRSSNSYYFKNIELNYYQYLQIKEIDFMFEYNKNIILYYLPNSKTLLKYELQ